MQPGIDSSDYEKYVTGFREVQATGYSGGFSGCFEPPTEDEFKIGSIYVCHVWPHRNGLVM